MKTKTRNFIIGTAIAAAIGATGMAVADMGGFGGACPQGAQMQQGHGMGFGGHGPMHGQGGHGMHGQGPGGMMGGMMNGMHEGMMGAMGLSTEQMTEMSKMRAEMLPLMGELRGKMQANHEQLRALQQDGAADQAAIDELADQKGALIAEMIKLRNQHQTRMQALLTDEQREQMRQHRHGMGGGMMGMRPMGG